MIDKQRVFQEYNTMLFSLAYNMLADVAAAGEIMEHTYRMWMGGDPVPTRQTKAWLVKTAISQCIDYLDEGPAPSRLQPPASAMDTGNISSYHRLSFDAMIRLDRLAPLERALFILHEVFAFDYGELAHIFQLEEDQCRRIFQKAQTRLGSNIRHSAVDIHVYDRMLSNFMDACLETNRQRLLSCLQEDVMLWIDWGRPSSAEQQPPRAPHAITEQRPHKAPHTIRGKPAVSQAIVLIMNILINKVPDFRWERVMANGLPSIVTYIGEAAISLCSFESTDGVIRNIYLQANQAKLKKLHHPHLFE